MKNWFLTQKFPQNILIENQRTLKFNKCSQEIIFFHSFYQFFLHFCVFFIPQVFLEIFLFTWNFSSFSTKFLNVIFILKNSRAHPNNSIILNDLITHFHSFQVFFVKIVELFQIFCYKFSHVALYDYYDNKFWDFIENFFLEKSLSS